MGKGGGQTIGYHYLFSILFGFGRGPINELRAIKVADKIAWDSHLCGSGPSAINKPDLFGGEKKEGGIQGPFYLNSGAADQVLPGDLSINVSAAPSGGGVFSTVFAALSGPWGGSRTLPAVKTSIGGLVSDFRGVTTLWFDGLISSMNPYPKDWKFRVRRYSAGWHNDNCWYPVKSVIFMGEGGHVHAMNPAHIIYECLTNPSWGRGLPASQLDENAFIYAANKLCEEGFGLCFAWQRKEDVDQFIKIVLDHIGGALYADPTTGKETLKLIRSDYVWADLPVFTPSSGLVEITDDDSASQDSAFNEVIGSGHDPITDEDFQLRVHNLAARYSNGAPNADDKSYPGVPTRDLLLRVLQRDLRQYASGLKKFAVVLDRSGFKIRPGMVFRIQDTRRGIADITLRAGEIEDVSFGDGKITIKAIQDVFSMPSTSFVTVPDQTWQPPAQEALPPLAERLIEAGYRDMIIHTGLAATRTAVDTDAFIGQLAVAPNTVSHEYKLITRAAGEPTFADRGIGHFTGTATLAAAIAHFDTTFQVANMLSFAEDNEGQALMFDDEVMELVDFNPATNMVTVKRGCADTIPSAHALGARGWTIDDDLMSDGRTYASGETVESVVLTRTLTDTLTPDEGAIDTVTLAGRQARPYPPANVQVNGQYVVLPFPIISYVDLVFTWTHRDRVMQEDQLVGYTEPNIGPEIGVTYRVSLYDDANHSVPVITYAGITDDHWTYTAAMQAVDGAPSRLYIELESMRAGIASWKKHSFVAFINGGYGRGYGMDYGGV